MIEKLCIWWLNLRWYHATWGEKQWKWSVIFRLLTTFTMAAMSSPLCSLVGQLPFPFRRRRPPNDSAACYLVSWCQLGVKNFAACCSVQRPCYVFVLFDFLNYAFVISSCVWSKLGNSPFLPPRRGISYGEFTCLWCSPIWGYVPWLELLQNIYLPR